VPKHVRNPRRFSKPDLDPEEPMVTHLALRPQSGSEEACISRLRAVLKRHPQAAYTISGLGIDGHHTVITVGVDLGGVADTMTLGDKARAGLALVPEMMAGLYDFAPLLVTAPDGEEADRGAEYAHKILGTKPRRRAAARPVARPAAVPAVEAVPADLAGAVA
jgi:hypothetical protein